ncbi:O-antigen ligase family protein [Neorhizobium sp. SOG26]|uniref:O-antigen ligase family protein n=1 Tax=Neorhizobium sp. SOG26 TaxID=2060726 RepID=UPI0012374C3D|nr:O-antigen ligase [Neorhizobium sp. SOG26]
MADRAASQMEQDFLTVHEPEQASFDSLNAGRISSAAPWSLGAVIALFVFGYFWIGLEPFATPGAERAATAGGDFLNQTVVILMFTVAVATVARDENRSALFLPHGLLLLILCWFSLVSMFAVDPATAFRRIAYAVLVCGCASAAILLPRSREEFDKLLATAVILVLGLCYFAVFIVPSIGIHQSSEVEAALAGDWRGIFGHKNMTAAAMALAVMFGLYLRKTSYSKVGTVAAVLAMVFLLLTRGKTATAMLPLVLSMVWIFERSKLSGMVILLGSIIVLNVVLIGLPRFEGVRQLLDNAGIDITFTGRDAIWAYALDRIGDRPWTGYGFQSFWGSKIVSKTSTESWAYLAAHSHNSFLELLLGGGLLGCLLVVVWLILLPIRDAGTAFESNNDMALTRLFLRIWIFCVLLGSLESVFFINSGPTWFSMLVAVFGLRLQASATLRSADEADRNRTLTH